MTKPYYLLIERKFDRVAVLRTTDEDDPAQSTTLFEIICGTDTEVILSCQEARLLPGHDGDLRIVL